MLKFKGCPKCHGDLSPGEDQYGKFLSCLQCGLLVELPQEPKVVKVKVAPGVEERQAA